MTAPTLIERALELARSGQFRSVAQIRARLRVEGYDSWGLEGRTLHTQLRGVIADARRRSQTIPGGELNASNDK